MGEFLASQKPKNDGLSKSEQQLYKEWIAESILWALAISFVAVLLSIPIYTIANEGFSKKAVDFLFTNPSSYFKTLFPAFGHWSYQYITWAGNSFVKPGIQTAVVLLPIFSFFMTLMIGISRNPYSNNSRSQGRGRMSYDQDVKAMGLLDGFIMVLGEWNGFKYKKKFLKLKETLSALVIAPPGTGKTTGVVVPTIFETDDVSMIVNDVKPEICDLTSGYRSRKSLCFRLEWAAEDKPDKKLYYPRWNPISPRSMPGRGPQRDLYIDRLVNVLIQDPKGDSDPHWTNKGRAALIGFIHFIANKCESGNYTGLPEDWVGEEACLPMLLDWATHAMLNVSDQLREKRKDKNDMSAMFSDPMRDFLENAVEEARANKYDSRAIMELTQLANTPDKERGSIMSTMDAGLTIFKNSAVRARTSKSDFGFEDVRGMIDPTDGKMKPLTIYLVVNQEDVKALSVITGVFIESLSAFLIAHKPNSELKDGRKMGPYPVLFVLDEFPQMPKLRALLDGPAVGRGQKVSYLLIAQDLGQIQETYGNDATETLMGTTAAKVIFTLTNTKTAERFEEMMGKETSLEVGQSWSRDFTWEGMVNPFRKSMDYKWDSGNLWGKADILNIKFGKQLVLFQGWTQRPIMADTPFYFKHPLFKTRVDPANGGKFPPASPLPKFLLEKRLIEEGQVSEKDTAPPPKFDATTTSISAPSAPVETVSREEDKKQKSDGKITPPPPPADTGGIPATF